MSEFRPNKLDLNVLNVQNNEISPMNSFASNQSNDKPTNKKKSRRQKSSQQSPECEKNKKRKGNQRIDMKGVKILKGGKKHQITFKNNLVQVHIIENWKEYNQFEEDDEEEEVGSCTACKRKCFIF